MRRLLWIAVLPCAACAVGGDASAAGTTSAAGDRAALDTGFDPTAQCAAAENHILACGGTSDQDYYGQYAGRSCADAGSSTADCEAKCVVAASCDSLLTADESCTNDGQGCTWCDDPAYECVYVCIHGECNTPLVLSFTRAPVTFEPASGSFDFGAGPIATDWPSAATRWLALDRNGNGRIDSAAELFGNDTPRPGLAPGANGFVPLSDLDANHDGVLTAADPAFSRLLLWTDRNGDRASQPAELGLLTAAGVVAIDLVPGVGRGCDDRGNCEGETADVRFTDAGGSHVGQIIDVYLRERRGAPLAAR